VNWRIGRFATLLGALYISCGILLWPSWWNLVLRDPFFKGAGGRLFFILHVALDEYLILNLVVFVSICLFTFAFLAAQKQGWSIAIYIRKFLESPAYFGALAMLGVIAAFRMELVHTLPTETATTKSAPAVPVPVDFVWLDESRIKSAYDQAGPELRLREKVVKDAQKTSIEGGASSAALSAKGATERSAEITQSFAPAESSAVWKAINLINGLNEEKRLQKITTIESQSREVESLDKAVKTLREKFGVEVSEVEVSAARRKLVEENIKELPQEFNETNWVLIKGEVLVLQNPTTTTMEFQYVPSIPGKAVFACEIPKPQSAMNDLQRLQDRSTWKLSLFGRLIQVPRAGSSGLYNILCYAVFR
jgi:hypothetical protein